MPKDQRLYMTFPNDFWMHPKVAPLSDAAFRAFVEMNGYSRMQDLDGRIPVVMAERLWTPQVLAELVGSHSTKPILLCERDAFVIRDYAQHQQTTEDRDALSRKRSEAGSRGRASQLRTSAGQLPGQIRAEIEIETNITTTDVVVTAPKRGKRIPEPFIVTGLMRQWASQRVPGVNVNTSTEKFVNYWRAKTRDGTKLDWRATWDNWLISDFEKLAPSKTRTEQNLTIVQQYSQLEQAGIGA